MCYPKEKKLNISLLIFSKKQQKNPMEHIKYGTVLNMFSLKFDNKKVLTFKLQQFSLEKLTINNI